MSQHPFKVGDWVKCIQGGDGLFIGDVYRVDEANTHTLHLYRRDSRYYGHSRFERVESGVSYIPSLSPDFARRALQVLREHGIVLDMKYATTLPLSAPVVTRRCRYCDAIQPTGGSAHAPECILFNTEDIP